MNTVEQQKQRLVEARERLMGTHVYFGGFAARMAWMVSKKVPTAATNGKKVWFNPDFIAGLSNRELYGLSVHEVGHPALGHDLRRKGRDPQVWNKAADIVLNNILRAEGIPLPTGGLDQPRYSGWTAEDVYLHLMENGHEGLPGGQPDDLRDNPDLGPKTNGKAPSDEDGEETEEDGEGEGEASGRGDEGADKEAGSGSGDGEEEGEEIDSSDLDGLDDEEGISEGEQQRGNEARSENPEAEWRILSENLTAMAQRVGQMAGDSIMEVAKARKSKLNWADHLAALIENADSTDDWNWKYPSRRFDGSSMLFPGDFNEEVKDIIIHVDTSGSMWNQSVMDHMAGEMTGILKSRNFKRAVIISVDHEVQKVEEIDPKYDELEFKPTGGGGTDFAPSFVWLEERAEEYDAACHVYLTDMYGSYGTPELVPDVPVFWVNYGYGHNTVPVHWEPISTVITVDRNEL